MFIYKCDLCKREIKDSKEMVTAAIGHGTGYCFCAGCGKPIVGVGTWSHCQRVAALATILARALSLNDEEIQVIADGALLHEIGKLAIPEAILRKPAKLSPEEMLVMRESSSRGYEMLRNVPSFAEAAEIVYAHRESFDGTGYPRGLKGEGILLGARIVGVADVVDLLINDRPHDGA